ncbi:uncharacterized protein EV420DRAFT_1574244 [Desarmillaria tabescens]|uniref:C2H2-type domain-containing protein n=1 Tax=Armillaria tabescens TaxID=1929756 RepID=A0AA39MS71_ARMTA|nr:uncharacterized protein EV420DRAFT_1574244 [Desarmillaria tabescens]KAK0444662.1 hypothetical protein EV420DRAFT_1574244 [Desarmillaria tabescens]
MTITVSLPSIHEMFPEHLLRDPPVTPPIIHQYSPTTSSRYSFDVLRSDPASSSLTHIASSDSLSYQPQSFPPPRRESTPLSSEDDEDGAKKHVCRTCHKRFNRPSSLRIHINTHTGATPFRCPFPGCGREFNVNSNMRRHYRNHTNPTAASLFPSPSSMRLPPSHPYLPHKRHPAVNRSEYVWHPASSNTSSDDEDDEQRTYKPRASVFGRQDYRSTSEQRMEISDDRDYVRRRISDVRTTNKEER